MLTVATTILVVALLAIVRRIGRSWWIWAATATVFFMSIGLMLLPVFIESNCGLYAMSYVMRHWYLKLKDTTEEIQQPPPVRKVDVEGAGKLPKDDPSKQASLRYIAKHANETHPLTFLGELFSAESMLTVAQRRDLMARRTCPNRASIWRLSTSSWTPTTPQSWRWMWIRIYTRWAMG